MSGALRVDPRGQSPEAGLITEQRVIGERGGEKVKIQAFKFRE